MTREDVVKAADAIAHLGVGGELSAAIRELESSLAGKRGTGVSKAIDERGIDEALLRGALTIKEPSAQIHVVIHVVGMLVPLPHILERGECIESLSLGAGNTDRDHDLVTDRRIAEFKFIEWRGGAESIRQNNFFIDLFDLASAETDKRRFMYVVDRRHPSVSWPTIAPLRAS